MNLYLVIAKNSDDALGSAAHWVGSQADAASTRKRFSAEGYKRAEVSTHEINVPTDKAGLIAFLNTTTSGPDVVAASEKLATS